jgi:hypothetical protein
VCLLFGVLGAFVALSTGDIAEELVRPNRVLVDMHSTFATITTWLYSALLLGEILRILKTKNFFIQSKQQIQSIIFWIEKILTHSLFSKSIAVIAFVALIITGVLGGVMVYGTNADPLAPIILSLLGITL